MRGQMKQQEGVCYFICPPSAMTDDAEREFRHWNNFSDLGAALISP
jgi:hypothetical protein